MKPGVYTKLFTHLIFAVKYRMSVLNSVIQPEVYRYIAGIIKNRKHKSILINGMPDHIHILIGTNPNDRLTDLVGCIKKESSYFINNQKWLPVKFQWQEGYGAFSFSKGELESVYNYVLNQEEHHTKSNFQQEYIKFLKKYQVAYDEKFIFKPVE
jgi:putative transposase